MVTLVLYAVDKGLRGQNVLQSVDIDSATYLLTISSPDIDNVAMSLYDIIATCMGSDIQTAASTAPVA